MPEDLWGAVVKLAGEHGLNATCTALKVNYYDLRRRLEPGRKERVQGKPTSPTFVEMPAVHATGPGSETVEIVSANGSRMTLRLSRHGMCDVLSLMKEFLRA